MKINKITEKLKNELLELSEPKGMQGGQSYTTKIAYDKANLMVQTESCITRNGFIVNGRKSYIDLLFNSDDLNFVNWIEDLEEKLQAKLFEKSSEWFENDLTKQDIEDSFLPSIRPFKSGKYYLLRCNSVLGNGINNANNVKIYNEEGTDFTHTDVTTDKKLITIIQPTDIKFSSKNFQIDFSVKQIMLLNEQEVIDEKLITIGKSKESKEPEEDKTNVSDVPAVPAVPAVVESVDVINEESSETQVKDVNETESHEDKDENGGSKTPSIKEDSEKPETLETSTVVEPEKVAVLTEPENVDVSTEPETSAVLTEAENVDVSTESEKADSLETKTDEIKETEKTEESLANNIDEIESDTNEKIFRKNDFILNDEEDQLKILFLEKTNLTEQHLKEEDPIHFKNELDELEDLEDSAKTKNIDNMLGNNLELEDCTDSIVANTSGENLKLKDQKEVYLEIYKAAREKAKIAKESAINAFLEVNKIKEKFDFEGYDSDDSNYLEELLEM